MTATPPPAAMAGVFWIVSHRWFNLGPFGVAIFFLISGMVVPFSLDKRTVGSFMVARLLRIFPTYAVALLLGLAAVYVSSRLWDRPLPFTPFGVFTNLTLINEFVGQPSLDLVNWTLAIELKFYLLIAVFAAAIRRASVTAVIAIGLAIYAGTVLMAISGHLASVSSTPSYTLSSHSLCLIYMLIGTLFNFHLRGRSSSLALICGATAMSGIFALTWQMSVWRDQFPVVMANYAYALGLFSILYSVRSQIPPNRLLDGLASISFPFYVVHTLIGFTLLRWLMVGWGFSYSPAMTITIVALLLLSLMLHRTIERPTQAFGRQLTSMRLRKQSQN